MSKEAPGELDTIRLFVNTLDLGEEVEESLDRPEALAAWLAEHGLVARRPKAGPADLRRAHEIREALRKLLLANNGFEVDPEALETLNHAAARARVAPAFEDHASWRISSTATGVDEGIGELLAIVLRAMADGSWQRLKACSEDSCQWAFYDKSKNRSGHWCSMAVCGNRAKARSFRARARKSSKRQ